MVRDRTSEFVATIKSMASKPQYLASQANGSLMELRARKGASILSTTSTSASSGSVPGPGGGGGSSTNSNNGYVATALSNPQSSQYNMFSRFMGGSRSVARDLYLTYQKLEKLNHLAQKRTIFDDEESTRELNELVYIVKQDITSLNQQIEQLRQMQLDSMGGAGGSANGGGNGANRSGRNARSHTKNVVLTLQQQLASISSSFKSTLELRTQNMKKQKKRREQFTNAPSINTPLMGGGGSNGVNGGSMVSRTRPNAASTLSSHQGLPHSHSTSALNTTANTATSTVINFDDIGDISVANGSSSNSNRPGHRPHNSVSGVQMQTVLQFEDQSNQYLEERANTMQSIESTIVELGTIFNQLTTLVHQQEEMITRIDANVSDTMANVEAAHESLLQYLQSVTSNRWLMLKIFGVLFVFFIIFVLFAS